MRKYGTLLLNSIALILGLFFALHGFTTFGISHIVTIIIVAGAGYLLGKWTCHAHLKKATLWFTVGLFSVLNILHSAIDGALLASNSSLIQIFALLSHELARQPLLMIVIAGVLSKIPQLSRIQKIAIIGIIVPVSWIIGVVLGIEFTHSLQNTVWIEAVVSYGMFFFIGDIMHHIQEDIRSIRGTPDCCHH